MQFAFCVRFGRNTINLLICRARPMSFQDTLDHLKKQDLDEGRLDEDTERWKLILEQRAAEKGQESQGKQPKMLWDVIIDAYNSEEHPKPIPLIEVSPFVQFMSSIKLAVRRVLYQIVENVHFSLFVAGEGPEGLFY